MSKTNKQPIMLRMSLDVDNVIYKLLKNDFALNGYKKEDIRKQIKDAFVQVEKQVNASFDIKVQLFSQLDSKCSADKNSYTKQLK